MSMSEHADHLSLPLLSGALVFTLAASLLIRVVGGMTATRVLAVLAQSVTTGMLAGAGWLRGASGKTGLIDPLWHQVRVDAFNETILVLYGLLTLVILLVAPRRDATGGFMAGVLIIFGSTVLSYAATSLGGFSAGWVLAAVPFALGWFHGPGTGKSPALWIAVVLSGIALTGAAALMGPGSMDFSHASGVASGLLLAAVALRKGLFPVHSWMAQAFDKGSPLPVVLFYNGHCGALLIVRAESTHLEGVVQQMLHVACWGALFTSIYTSFLMIAERRPRRLLALLCVSQAAFILAGLSSGSHHAVTGALIHWIVVAVASTGLVSVYRALEARFAGVEECAGRYLGLAAHAPRLAVFFIVFGLALVGLPGTLGYSAEDLLFQGALESHPVIGLALYVSTALNAIHLFRLFSRLFLGRSGEAVPEIPDALLRERIPLTVCVLFLIVTGLLPAPILRHREAVAQRIHEALESTGPQTH